MQMRRTETSVRSLKRSQPRRNLPPFWEGTSERCVSAKSQTHCQTPGYLQRKRRHWMMDLQLVGCTNNHQGTCKGNRDIGRWIYNSLTARLTAVLISSSSSVFSQYIEGNAYVTAPFRWPQSTFGETRRID